MEFPQLPTDNLYKFMAIFGLVIVILCFVLPLKMAFDLETQLARLDGQLVGLGYSEKILGYKVKAWQDVVKAKGRCPNGMYAHVLRSEIVSLKSQATALGEKMAALDATQTTINDMSKNMKSSWKETQIWVFVGSFFMVVGFRLWYLRVQRYHDIMLKEEAKKLSPSAKSTDSDDK